MLECFTWRQDSNEVCKTEIGLLGFRLQCLSRCPDGEERNLHDGSCNDPLWEHIVKVVGIVGWRRLTRTANRRYPVNRVNLCPHAVSEQFGCKCTHTIHHIPLAVRELRVDNECVSLYDT